MPFCNFFLRHILVQPNTRRHAMKCSVIECRRVARNVYDMSLGEVEKQLIKCNKCFFALDPTSRYRKSSLPYATRNIVGGHYALIYTKEKS